MLFLFRKLDGFTEQVSKNESVWNFIQRTKNLTVTRTETRASEYFFSAILIVNLEQTWEREALTWLTNYGFLPRPLPHAREQQQHRKGGRDTPLPGGSFLSAGFLQQRTVSVASQLTSLLTPKKIPEEATKCPPGILRYLFWLLFYFQWRNSSQICPALDWEHKSTGQVSPLILLQICWRALATAIPDGLRWRIP